MEHGSKLSNILDQYRELISEASSQIQGKKGSRLWWAGYISSKNRFYDKNEKILDLIKDPEAYVKEDRGISILKPWLKSLVRSIFYFCKVVLNFALANISEKRKIFEISKKKDLFVLTTFSYEKDFNSGSYKDSFWGGLPQEYRKRDQNFLYFSFPLFSFRSFLKKSDETNELVSFFSFITIKDLISIFSDVFLSRSAIELSSLKVKGVDVSESLNKIIATDLRSSATINSLLLYYACRRLACLDVKKYFYIFEGNYWERLQIESLRKFSPKTQIIGYQHNIISQATFNYFPGSKDSEVAPLPDKILTTGEITAKRLNQFGDYGKVPIEASCAIRYDYLFKLERSPRTEKKVVLVALEGLRQSVEMLNSLLEFAGELKDWEIRVRTHPIFPISEVKKFLKYDLGDFSNVVVSKTPSLLDDLKSSNIVMYWASTVALESLRFGIPVVNFKKENFYDTDPIFDLEYLKGDFTQGSSPTSELERLYKLQGDAFESEYQSALKYLDSYLTPVTSDNLVKFF